MFLKKFLKLFYIEIVAVIILMTTVSAYAKQVDASNQYGAQIALVLKPYNGFLNRAERAQRFKFDDYARTSLTLYRMRDLTGIDTYEKTYSEVKKGFSIVWKKLFTAKIRFRIKKVGNNYEKYRVDASYAYMRNRKGKIVLYWGDPGEDDYRVGNIRKITRTKKNSYRVIYDLYRYDWLNDRICEIKSTWQFMMRKIGKKFKIQSIKRTIVY